MLRLVINLDRSPKRMDDVRNKLSSLGVDFERVSAVDGSLISDNESKKLVYPLTHVNSKVGFRREMTKGEIGCFLSHKRCWERLLNSSENWAVIMEDDINLSSRIAKYLLDDNWIPKNIGICQLSGLRNEISGRAMCSELIKVDDFLSILEPVYPEPMGTQCYLISRDAAKLAIELSRIIPAPVDNFLFSDWFSFKQHYKTYKTSPLLVVPDNNLGTDIGVRSKDNPKKAPFWIRHGLRHFLMSRRIKKLQQRGEQFTFKFEK